jgi:hypothetical protein
MLGALFCSNAVFAEYDPAALQKLFTDKKQRAQIDAARSGNLPTEGGQVTDQVKVSGYVKRSDGKDVVWLNNGSTLESNRQGNLRVRQSDIGADKRVTVTVDGRTVRLKPGETWHKETGKIIDSADR